MGMRPAATSTLGDFLAYNKFSLGLSCNNREAFHIHLKMLTKLHALMITCVNCICIQHEYSLILWVSYYQ